MKIIILMAALLGQNLAAATMVKDLEVKCNIKAKITEVFNIKYDPGLPARGRFGGTPPSLGFQASLETISQETGCSVLTDKYKIYLGNLSAYGGITNASKLQTGLIEKLKNEVVDLKLNQSFGYQSGSGYLPLFPLVHSETLSFSFASGLIHGGVALPFDLNWVYGIPKIENMSDIEKLSLAEKATVFAFKGDFPGLFMQLEPEQKILKKSYALLIWKMFKQYLESNPYETQLLEFHVGGTGSQQGAPMAVKLNVISHIPGLFSSDEIVQLLTDFPTWILAGYNGNDCLNFTAADLENFLETVSVELPVLSLKEKWLLRDPMMQIAGPIHYVTQCTEGKVTEHSKMLAVEILKVLN